MFRNVARFARVGKMMVASGVVIQQDLMAKESTDAIQPLKKVEKIKLFDPAPTWKFLAASFIDTMFATLLSLIFVPLTPIYLLFRGYRNMSVGHRLLGIKTVKSKNGSELSLFEIMIQNFEFFIVSVFDIWGTRDYYSIKKDLIEKNKEIAWKTNGIISNDQSYLEGISDLEKERFDLEMKLVGAGITRTRVFLPLVSCLAQVALGRSIGGWIVDSEIVNDASVIQVPDNHSN